MRTSRENSRRASLIYTANSGAGTMLACRKSDQQKGPRRLILLAGFVLFGHVTLPGISRQHDGIVTRRTK
jgi:hypothetical protein